jgi:hypothetical protein
MKGQQQPNLLDLAAFSTPALLFVAVLLHVAWASWWM